MGRQLWLMRADGSDAHALTNDADVHYGPFAWSPDGRYILLQRYDLAEPYARAAIGLLEVGTGIMREVAAPGMQPAWLP
jgi:Tol biopolymer transport system component